MNTTFKHYFLLIAGLLFTGTLFSQTPCASPTCSPVPMTDVCSDGTNTVTLTCDSGLGSIIWYNSSGTQVGTGCDLIVSCPGESCCPVNVTVLNCMTCTIVGVDPTCNGTTDGSATVTPANGVAPFTYSWSDGQSTVTATNLAAGTYTVTVSDAAGGTSECSVTLVELSAVSCTVTTSNATCFGMSDGSAAVAATGGTAGYTYNWNNGITTASNPNLVAGTYSVTVTDANGCTAVCSGAVTEPSDISCSISPTNPSCNAGTDGSLVLTVSGGTGAYTFDWDNDGAEDPDNDPQDLTGIGAGTYRVTITDANGCTAWCAESLLNPPALTCSAVGTDPSNCGTDDGTVTVTSSGGTPALTYSLNGGTAQSSNVFTGLAAGTYTVTTADANGCTIDCIVTITAPASPMCTITGSANVSCAGGSDGSLTVTGTGGSGTLEYSLNGGTSVCNEMITEPPALTCMASATDASCAGANDGEVTVTAMGGTTTYTYLWSNSSTTQTITGLTAGTYMVTITDSNSCEVVCSATVNESTALSCSIVGTDPLCNGAASGEADLTIAGGVSPFTYSWSTADGTGLVPTVEDQIGLTAGTYTVTVTDDNGCSTTCNVVLTEPTLLACSASATDQTDCGVNDGTVTALGTGGTPGYLYSLNGGTSQSSGLFTGLMAGTYTIIVTDDNGCTSECTATVNTPSAPMCAINTFLDVSCNGLSDGSLTATGTGGSGSYEFSLNGGTFQSSGLFANLAAGSYTVTVRNAGDPMCTSVCNIMIDEPEPLSCSMVEVNPSCNTINGPLDGEVAIVASGGTAGYTYLWSTGGTGTSITSLGTGTYSVTVTDANGCTTTCSSTIVEPEELVCNLILVDPLCNVANGLPDGEIDVTATGGTGTYTYTWTTIDGSGVMPTTEDQTGLSAGTYDVVVTDDNGCTTACTATLSEPTELTCNPVATDVSECGANDGIIDVIATGGTGAYLYALNGGTPQTGSDFTGLAAGSYTVEVTDANGCTTLCTAIINAPSAPMCTISNVVDLTCNGSADGSFLVEGTGGSGNYEYSTDGVTFQNVAAFTDLAAGSYTITIINAGQPTCSSTCNVTLVEPPLLECMLTQTDVTCNGGSDGSATVSELGGVAPYTYVWSTVPNQTSATATMLLAGNYSVEVTDANGCTSVCNLTIAEPPVLSCSLAGTNITCNGGADGIQFKWWCFSNSQ